MSLRLPQAIALGVAILIAVLLFIAPRTPSVPDNSTATDEFSTDSLLTALEANVGSSAREEYKGLKERFMKGDTSVMADLARFWSAQHAPFGIAVYRRMLAEKSGNPSDWLKAGMDFQRMANMASPERKSLAYGLAMHAFRKVLEKEPAHRDARLRLAVCQVEGSQDPMKGVELLRELVKEDSTYIDAHLQLGFFSLQSRQYDKAIERFRKILAIDTGYADCYLYTGQALEMKGDVPGAVEEYEKYYIRVQDSVVRQQLRSYINKILETKKN